MSVLVWLFKEHRDLYQRASELERRIVEISTKAEEKIADLEAQLIRRPDLDVQKVVEQLFQDEPYTDGRIPDNAWLTPGYPDRAVK